MKLLKKFNNGAMKILDFIVVLVMMALCLVVGFQVINRFALHLPAAWTEEIGRFVFVWASLFGTVKASRLKLHLSVDAFVDGRSYKTRRILGIFAEIIILIFAIILLITGFKYTMGSIGVTASFGTFPMVLVYGAMPVAGLFMALLSIEDLLKLIISKEEVGVN